MLVLWPLKPFWIDEWRLLYNVKFKDSKALWGPLDFTQQFPRLFLVLLKQFTHALGYSYFSLRLPAFFVSVSSMILAWRLMKRHLVLESYYKYLFVLVLVSSQTFTDYLVQFKQYEMEIFLSLLGFWQLSVLIDLHKGISAPGRYLLLCLSLLAAPFFSYTYPIAMAPVFPVCMLLSWQASRSGMSLSRLLYIWAPLVLLAFAIGIFYAVDVSQLMQDEAMHKYWSYRMLSAKNPWLEIPESIWGLFAKTGSGFLFEIIFGILGMAGLGIAIKTLWKNRNAKQDQRPWLLLLYAVLLMLGIIVLFLAGKLPLSEPKFNAFAVPAISILIIHLLDTIYEAGRKKAVLWITALLFAGLAGNIVSTVINSFTAPEYSKRVRIYKNTEQAIVKAQQAGVPLLVTPGVAYPDDIVHVAP
ncbi:MAG: hypothetical protein EOP49_41285, partial [Sphingobacteriales bacterium]